MSSNKGAKEELIRRYGKQCFIERLGLRDTSGLKYTGKAQYKKMKMLTYHHIKERCKGGKATVENGALLSSENHQWFNQQSKEEQARMNQQFQELKRKIDNAEECLVQLVPEAEIEMEKPIEIDIMTVEADKKGKMSVKTAKKKKYSRAKHKRKTKKMIRRYYGGER